MEQVGHSTYPPFWSKSLQLRVIPRLQFLYNIYQERQRVIILTGLGSFGLCKAVAHQLFWTHKLCLMVLVTTVPVQVIFIRPPKELPAERQAIRKREECGFKCWFQYEDFFLLSLNRIVLV